jgi:ketohexokinase
MPNILGIGIATLDIINTVDGYPQENSEIRALNQSIQRGGNTTNTLVVLSQLGHRCTWAGVLPQTRDADYIRTDLAKYNIDCSVCRLELSGTIPTSYIALNRKNGSRTIIHYRDLPEFSFENFKKIALNQFDWLHFEGRNVPETRQMLDYAKTNAPSAKISLEVEKPRPDIESLFPYPNTILFSQTYAQHSGFHHPRDFLESISHIHLGQELICTWGEQGAYALNQKGRFFSSPAFPPQRIVDTLAAGDTFNAGLIDAKLRNPDLPSAIEAACRLAGKKCGQMGLDGLIAKQSPN